MAADLYRANLTGADLRLADLTHAVLHETILADTNLNSAIGLEFCTHRRPSVIDHRTLVRSWPLPEIFLRGCGLPEALITYLPSLISEGAIQFYSCFISYSHADKSFARRLHDTLQCRGIRCWLDEKQLLPGDDIYHHVDEGIRLWDKVLLCCSQNSVTSWWVDNEIGKAFSKEQALMKERKEKVLALIPLDLDGYLFRWKSGKGSQVLERLAANSHLADIHDRMPVILPSGAYASWLNPSMRDARVASGWLLPYAGAMRRYPVSTRINQLENDDAECARAVELDIPPQRLLFA